MKDDLDLDELSKEELEDKLEQAREQFIEKLEERGATDSPA
jgi:hypothetical protein